MKKIGLLWILLFFTEYCTGQYVFHAEFRTSGKCNGIESNLWFAIYKSWVEYNNYYPFPSYEICEEVRTMQEVTGGYVHRSLDGCIIVVTTSKCTSTTEKIQHQNSNIDLFGHGGSMYSENPAKEVSDWEEQNAKLFEAIGQIKPITIKPSKRNYSPEQAAHIHSFIDKGEERLTHVGQNHGKPIPKLYTQATDLEGPNINNTTYPWNYGTMGGYEKGPQDDAFIQNVDDVTDIFNEIAGLISMTRIGAPVALLLTLNINLYSELMKTANSGGDTYDIFTNTLDKTAQSILGDEVAESDSNAVIDESTSSTASYIFGVQLQKTHTTKGIKALNVSLSIKNIVYKGKSLWYRNRNKGNEDEYDN